MKRIYPLVVSFLLLAVTGCSTISSWQSSMSTRFDGTVKSAELTGGEFDGQNNALYWLTVSASQPKIASDFVEQSNNAWYKTTYQWQSGVIEEIVRQGEMLPSGSQSLVPFLVHIRFNGDGEAVYQRYRVDNQILPLNQTDLASYSQDSEDLLDNVEELHSQGMELVQGMWNGETFESCDGNTYDNLQFEHAPLPLMVKQRINGLTSYAAFIGKTNIRHTHVSVNELLILDKASHGCINRPNLIVSE